ncbi:MAG: HEAT repeat domain-containing protein [Gemmatimonadales bacterium]
MAAHELVASLGRLAPAVWSWLLTYLVHSTILLGLAALATRWWVRSDGWRELLWKTALVGGIVSASIQQLSPDLAMGQRMALAPATAPAREVRPDLPVASSRRNELVSDPIAPAGPETETSGADGVTTLAEPAASARAAAKPISLSRSLMALWLGLAALLLARLVLVRRRYLSRLGVRRPITDLAVLEPLEGLREAAGLKRRVLLTSTRVLMSPVALGYREICLPEAALEELEPEQIKGLLAHELGHLVRLDPWWMVLAAVIERVFFLQPLNRLARRGIVEAAEYLADDWAVRRTGTGVSLAKCLVKVAEWIDTAPRAAPVAGMAEDPSHLVTRVRRLIEERAMAVLPSRRRTTAVASGILTLSVVMLPGFTSGSQPARLLAEQDSLRTLAPAVERKAIGGDSSPERLGPADDRTTRLVDQPTPATEALGAALTRAQDTGVVVALIAALADSDVEVRRAVARALGEHKDLRAIPAFTQALDDGDAEVRRAAIEGLSEFRDRRTVPAMISALDDGSAEVRRAAANALGELSAPEAYDALVRATRDSDAEVRYGAISALAELEDRRAVPTLVDALADRSSDVRRRAADALGDLEDPRAVPALTGLLDDRDPEVRQEALEGLAHLELDRLPAKVVALLGDADADVRQAALEAVARHPDPSAVAAIRPLMADASPEVRRAAVEALAEIRTEQAIDLIVTALKSSDPEVRKAAAEALGKR